MRKIKYLAMCAAVIMIAGLSTTAFAGVYDPETNDVNVDGNGYKTVLITEKNNNNNILYVGQTESEFNASTDFLLRDNPTAGFYTIKLGGSESGIYERDFYIGSADEIGKYAAETEGAIKLNKEFDAEQAEDGTYTLAFATETPVSMANMKTIILKVGEKYLVKETGTTFTGEGTASVGIQITGVSEEQKESGVSVYITPIALQGGIE